MVRQYLSGEGLRWLGLAVQLYGSVVPAVLPRTLFCALLGILVSGLYELGLPLVLLSSVAFVPNLSFAPILPMSGFGKGGKQRGAQPGPSHLGSYCGKAAKRLGRENQNPVSAARFRHSCKATPVLRIFTR